MSTPLRLWPELIFRLVADDDDSRASERVRIFRAFLVLHLAARFWATIGRTSVAWEYGLALATTAAAGLSFVPRLSRGAVAFVGAIMLGLVVRQQPVTANHEYVEFFLVALAAFCDVRIPAERALFVCAVRWVAILVFFWPGVRKVLFGTYFHGEYLSFCVAAYPSFRDTLGQLLGDAEVVRLQGLQPLGSPSGPFRVGSALFLVASNASYLGEIGLSVGLLFRRTRAWAAGGLILLVLFIEVAAREVFFGGLAVLMATLFLAPKVSRRAFTLVLAVYAAVLLTHFGFLPEWTYKL